MEGNLLKSSKTESGGSELKAGNWDRCGQVVFEKFSTESIAIAGQVLAEFQ